jgi:hypothetical protein
MGALLPVGSGPDAEIVQTLNGLFKGDNLKALRSHHKLREKLFGPGHRLRRVALRIGAYPTRDYGTDDAKRKWFFFLHHVLPQATQDAIKRILNDAMTRLTIKAVEFSVEENSVVSAPHLFPSNSETQLTSYMNAARDKYRVHLVVKAPMADDAEDPPDNDPDSDEQPIEWPTLKLGKPPLGKARKGSKSGGKKKAAKKKAYKTSRKR